MKDLFETPELIPTNVQAILDTWKDEGCRYKQCRKLIKKLNKIGYTFDYGLDGEPYDLHRTDLLNTMKKVINEVGERGISSTDVVEFIYNNKHRIGDGIEGSELWNNKVADILGYYLIDGEEYHEKFNKLNLVNQN